MEAYGFTLVTDEPFNRGNFVSLNKTTKSKGWAVPDTYFQIMFRLRDLGFLAEPNPHVHFADFEVGKFSTRKSFSVMFDGRLNPVMNIRVRSNRVMAGKTNMLNDTSLDDLETNVKARFAQFDFTPEHGWGYLHYLDFVLNYKREWTEEDIRQLDEYKSQGVSTDRLWLFMKNKVPLDTIADFLLLPDSWIEHTFPRSKKKQDKK